MSDIILQKEVYETVCIKRHDGKVLSEFSFNPSDANIVERYDDFLAGMQELSEKIKKYEFSKEKSLELDETKKALKEITNEICQKVNQLLNEDVSDNIFNVMSPLSPLPSGDYYFIFIVDQIGHKIRNATGQRIKKIETKVKKHTTKYHG